MRISDWSSDVCSSDLERRQRFFQRHSKIIVMGLIEVDIIGLQSSQRILDCAFYMTRRQAATPRRCFTSNLGRDQDLVALSASVDDMDQSGNGRRHGRASDKGLARAG